MFYWALIGRAILSFFPMDYNSPAIKIYQVLVQVTEIICAPARALMDRLGLNTGPFDFSLIVAFILLRIIYRILTFIIIGGWSTIGIL